MGCSLSFIPTLLCELGQATWPLWPHPMTLGLTHLGSQMEYYVFSAPQALLTSQPPAVGK